MTDQNEYSNVVAASNVVQITSVQQLNEVFGQRDAGYFFAPYVPLTQTPILLDPNSLNNEGIVARYSREALDQGQSYYGRIIIDQFGIRDEPMIYSSFTHEEEPEKVNWLKEGF